MKRTTTFAILLALVALQCARASQPSAQQVAVAQALRACKCDERIAFVGRFPEAVDLAPEVFATLEPQSRLRPLSTRGKQAGVVVQVSAPEVTGPGEVYVTYQLLTGQLGSRAARLRMVMNEGQWRIVKSELLWIS